MLQLALMGSSALVIATSATAQAPAGPRPAEAAPPGEATSAQHQGVGDIVVTASRRSESQQKVPIAISAFKSDTLNTLGIKTTVDLPQLTPGLVVMRTLGGVNPYLRGIGNGSSGYTTEPPVAKYVDGVYLPNSGSAAFSFNNIERIEVLKGPQGTLYGRNTIGGLISVITRDPGRKPSVDASASFANYNTATVNVYASTPLSDTLGVNIAATYTYQGKGWGRNIYLQEDVFRSKVFRHPRQATLDSRTRHDGDPARHV